MLLEFKIKNYKSFVDEMCFSMIPAAKQKGLDYSVFNESIGKHIKKGLCSAVIYGPNASGKRNIIGAMDTFRSIILKGNIKNSDNVNSNIASSLLELIPNCNLESTPTSFSISFIEKGLLIKYELIIELGKFLSKDFKRKIIYEKLSINDKDVFIRDKDLEIMIPSIIKNLSNQSINRITLKTKEIAKNSLQDEELFLTNGFKTIFAQDLVSLIINWFQYKFIIVYSFNKTNLISRFQESSNNKIAIEKTLLAAKEFGINSNSLDFKVLNNKDETILCSIFNDTKIAIPAELFESYGTMRFINEFPLIINSLLNGSTLVIDEFDASIHPIALMNIISIFHNDEININHAQLIFNTHNPIFLDSSLFRRDEIKFVERDSSNQSIHYSLSDFKTAKGTRNGEDYMKNYFINKYGAIKDIDFTSILKEILTSSKSK